MRTAERMARRAARVAAKESLEKEKEERIKGLGSRDAEHILNEYPDTDTDSDCYEVVDGQRAKVRPAQLCRLVVVASALFRGD